MPPIPVVAGVGMEIAGEGIAIGGEGMATGGGAGAAYGPPPHTGLEGSLIQPVLAGPVIGPGPAGGGGAYGPPAHTGLVGWLMHIGSPGPVGGWAAAGTAEPPTAIAMNAPATALLVTALRMTAASLMLIDRSFAQCY
jgi:hypothetical protein